MRAAVVIVAVAACACACAHPAPRAPSPVLSPAAQLAADLPPLLARGDLDGAMRRLDRDEAAAAHDPKLATMLAYFRATTLVYRGDLEGAWRVLDDASRGVIGVDPGGESNLRSQRAWVRWGLGDLDGALDEIDALDRASQRGPADDRAGWHQHVLADRAYLTLERAVDRHDDAAITAAEAIEAGYDAAAPDDDHASSRAVLAAYVAARLGHLDEARRAAARIDVTTADAQDLFVDAMVAVLAGDAARARTLRAQIARDPYLMKPLVLRVLDRALAAGPPASW